jgi:hypothetical protein
MDLLRDYKFETSFNEPNLNPIEEVTMNYLDRTSTKKDVTTTNDWLIGSFEIFNGRAENSKLKQTSAKQTVAAKQTVTTDEVRKALGLWDNTAIPGF